MIDTPQGPVTAEMVRRGFERSARYRASGISVLVEWPHGEDVAQKMAADLNAQIRAAGGRAPMPEEPSEHVTAEDLATRVGAAPREPNPEATVLSGGGLASLGLSQDLA